MTALDKSAVRPRSLPDRAARFITEVFAPAVWAAVMPIVIALHSCAPAWATGAGWGLLAVLFCSVVPYAVIWVGVRRGRLTDHHIGVREQRRMPLVYGLVSVLLGLLLLAVLGAPRALLSIVALMFAVGLVVTAINQVWKLSVHAAVAAASASALVAVFGVLLVPSFLLVALVGWSRVRLADHTAGQAMAGVAVGMAIAAVMIAG